MAGVQFQSVHVERAVPRDHHGAISACAGDTDGGAEAVPHPTHAQRDDEPSPPAMRQVVDGGRAGVARVHHDVGVLG